MEEFKGKPYLTLETFRKSGEGVRTPMWFALIGEKVYMTTRGQSGKVKRIRNNPAVKLALSNSNGRLLGPLHDGRARLVEEEALFEEAVQALNRKYGLKKKLIDFALRFAKDQSEAILEVSPADPTGEAY